MSEKERTEESAETAAATGAETAAEETREATQETTQEAAQNTESDTAQAEDPAEALRGELAAEKDRNMRLLADFDNFRRRVTREKNETYQRATEAAIVEFLPVLDNFDRAIAQAPATGDPFADGMRMVYEQFSNVLSKAGVTPIPAVGEPFNPDVHEAIAYQPSPDAPEGHVVYEAKRGYRMGDRVVRPASVIVSSGAPKSETMPETPATDNTAAADADSCAAASGAASETTGPQA